MNFLSVLYAKAGIIVDGVTTLNNTATGLTPATNDNSTKLATTGYVKNQNYYPYPTGTTAQYVRGDGSLATFTQTGGGGSSVSYYLNGGTSQGTIGGNTYYEMSKIAVIGAAADFNLNADGYIAQFVTDAGDPALLSIPVGNWNFEMFFSASSSGGTPSFYVELYKYDGTTLTLISSGSTNPESITSGTATDLYLTSLAVPTTTLTLTDRLAIRVYVNHSGRTITLHTQDSHLCQVITTFTTGLTALNGLTAQVQNFAVGAGGSDFNISSVTDTHTFNLPTASATNRGALSSTDWTTFNNKQNALTNPITGTGTTNYLPKFTGTSALGNSTIFDNGSNVYLNTTTGTYRFEANAGSSQYINARFYGSSHSMIQVESTTAGFQALIAHKSPTGEYSVGLQGDGRYAIYHNTGAAERFTITSAGNVGIGTASPANKLDVNGSVNIASTYFFRYDGDTGLIGSATSIGGAANQLGIRAANDILFATNGANERMRITSSGNVGIGTTSPSEKFEVQNAAAGAKIKVSNSGGGYATLECSSNATSVAQLSFTNQLTLSGGNVFLSNGLTAANLINITGNDSQVVIGSDKGGGASLKYNSNGNLDITPRSGFNTIFTAGNVGIGTTSPVAIGGYNNLDIRGTSGSLLYMGIDGATASLRLIAEGTNAYIDNLNTTGNILFRTNNATERMRLTLGGNVLIGTTTDAGYKLTIAGNSNSYSVSPHAVGIDIYSTGNIAPHYQTNYTWYTGLIGAGTFRMGLDASGNLTASSFIKSGGTAAQFLKADGSVDSSTYATTGALAAYLPLAGGTMTGNIIYSPGDATNWYIRGAANGAVLRLKYSGGTTNRSGSLAWVDNANNYSDSLTWTDSSVNSNVALQQNGNQVLHAGNYNSYAVAAYYGYDVPMAQTGDWIGMTTTSGISGWTHVINMAWQGSQANWVSQIAFAAQTGTGAYYRTTAGAITSVGWTQLIDGNNIGGYLSGYLPLSGGTITGDLTVNNKVYVGTHGCYFQEVLISGVYELQVVDSAGNITVIS